MLHYVGLDVSMKTTFVCIVNEKGKIVKEIEASSIPEEIGGFLLGTGLQIGVLFERLRDG
jgi:transposase